VDTSHAKHLNSPESLAVISNRMELVHAKKLNAADLQAYAISIGVPMSAAKVNGKWLKKEALMDLIKSVVEERHSQVVRTAARRIRHSIARFDED
jgi:hypothetical protein